MRHETFLSQSDETKTQKMETPELKRIKIGGKSERKRVSFSTDMVVLLFLL